MKFVGKRVDHGDVRIRGHFFEDALLVHAGNDAMDPALEVARDIGDGFARAERRRRLRVVEEYHRAAHALDADVEGDTRAKRGLFENERDEFAVQRGGVADRTSLDVRGEMKQFARMRRAPFRSSKEIVRQRNGYNESRRGHFFTLPQHGRRAPGSWTCRNPERGPVAGWLREPIQRAGEIRAPARG